MARCWRFRPPHFRWTQKTALESQKGRNGAHPLSSWTPGHRINTVNPKDYAITTCDDAIRCPKPWTPEDSGYVKHEIGMVQNRRQPRYRRTEDPVRQMALSNRQNVSICREI